MRDKKKGSALFVALMLLFIGLILIGGLAALWLRLHHITFPIRTYSSVREAAAGGIDLVRQLIDNGKLNVLKCSESNPCSSIQKSCKITIKYRLIGSNALHDNIVCVKPLGQFYLVGFQTFGVAYSGGVGMGSLYGFNSTATATVGNGTPVSAYIETVYLFINKTQ